MMSPTPPEGPLGPALSDAIARYAHAHFEEELELLRQLARIPAPTRGEARRARFVEAWLRGRGATSVSRDEAGNVICLLGSEGARDLVAFSAHTDIVFDDQGELPLEETATELRAPGVGDDTANLVGLLMATAFLLERPQLLPSDTGVLVVANACEEGLGNLDGMRAVFDAQGSRIRSLVSFDLYLGQVIDTAVGSHRFRIRVRTQGGHSFHDFGRKSAIAELAAIVCELYAQAPRSGSLRIEGAPVTLNVGRIEGGTTINAIAAEASALYEYRSTSDAALTAMRRQLERIVDGHRQGDVRIEIELLGVRPGAAALDAPSLERLTRRNSAIVRAITGKEPMRTPASTDANIPLSRGIPANTVGTVRGALLHTRDEWIEKASLIDGLQVILGIMLASWGAGEAAEE